jgi:hypothetical protein
MWVLLFTPAAPFPLDASPLPMLHSTVDIPDRPERDSRAPSRSPSLVPERADILDMVESDTDISPLPPYERLISWGHRFCFTHQERIDSVLNDYAAPFVIDFCRQISMQISDRLL